MSISKIELLFRVNRSPAATARPSHERKPAERFLHVHLCRYGPQTGFDSDDLIVRKKIKVWDAISNNGVVIATVVIKISGIAHENRLPFVVLRIKKVTVLTAFRQYWSAPRSTAYGAIFDIRRRAVKLWNFTNIGLTLCHSRSIDFGRHMLIR